MDTLLGNGNIWIILFILLFFVPMAQKNILQRDRKRLLAMLGKKRGSQVITLIHRQETISFLGLPISRYIDIDDSEQVLRAIRTAPKEVPLDIILHTTQIAMALKAHPSRKAVIVPHFAMSGGTLIAMAADEIIMDPHAALGPVDPQLGDQTTVYPATSLLKAVKKKCVDGIDDKTLVFAEEAEKALKQIDGLVRRIMADRCGAGNIEKIIEEHHMRGEGSQVLPAREKIHGDNGSMIAYNELLMLKCGVTTPNSQSHVRPGYWPDEVDRVLA